MDKTDLKPCPFCGGRNLLFAEAISTISCADCWATGPQHRANFKMAMAQWNMRVKDKISLQGGVTNK